MNWKTDKNGKVARALVGKTIASVEPDVKDGNVIGLTITATDGQRLRCQIDTYSFSLLHDAPPAKEKRHCVIGTVGDGDGALPVNEQFVDCSDAFDRKRQLEVGHTASDLRLEEVEVEVPF